MHLDEEYLKRRGICLILSAPSGTGKSSVVRQLLARDAALTVSVSVTTRAPRPGEREGVDYAFRTAEEFAALRDAGALLEWASVYGRAYGTPRAPVEAALAAGRDVVFDIDWQGHRQVRAALPRDTVGVFLLPPSRAALRARLEGRAGDSAEEIGRRLAAAAADLAHWAEFDHVLINDRLETCVEEVQAILRASRTATARRTGLEGLVAALSG